MNKNEITNRAVELIINSKPKEFTELNVNKVAELLDISVPHLSREFKKKMNISLHEYILREKIKRSCFILKQNESLTVKKVSKIFDLSSCNYFIKVFKKYVGLTPGEFRKIDNGFFGLSDRRISPFDRRFGVKINRKDIFDRKFESELLDRRKKFRDRRIDLEKLL